MSEEYISSADRLQEIRKLQAEIEMNDKKVEAQKMKKVSQNSH